MLRSILMIFIQELALIYGIVTHVSEPSQNLVGMNEKFWAVWGQLDPFGPMDDAILIVSHKFVLCLSSFPLNKSLIELWQHAGLMF